MNIIIGSLGREKTTYIYIRRSARARALQQRDLLLYQLVTTSKYDRSFERRKREGRFGSSTWWDKCSLQRINHSIDNFCCTRYYIIVVELKNKFHTPDR